MINGNFLNGGSKIIFEDDVNKFKQKCQSDHDDHEQS